MTEKKDDFGTWAILGALGAAVVAAIAGGLSGFKSNQPVNSYQATSSYSPPSSNTSGGCGCSAGR